MEGPVEKIQRGLFDIIQRAHSAFLLPRAIRLQCADVGRVKSWFGPKRLFIRQNKIVSGPHDFAKKLEALTVHYATFPDICQNELCAQTVDRSYLRHKGLGAGLSQVLEQPLAIIAEGLAVADLARHAAVLSRIYSTTFMNEPTAISIGRSTRLPPRFRQKVLEVQDCAKPSFAAARLLKIVWFWEQVFALVRFI